MSKTTRRVLSMVITVFMLISMVSVFTLPALAEEVTDAVDYDAAFESAYIINNAWTDDDLAGEADLTVTFRGEVKTVNPKQDKLFNNFKDARDDAYAEGKVSADNYFTYMPVFIFAAGDYTSEGVIHVPTPAKIWGPNAGINPNAEVDAADRDIAWLQANNGWLANEARGDEAIIGGVYLNTRKLDTTNECAENTFSTYVDAEGNLLNTDITATHTYSDVDSQWQYYMDNAFRANPDATMDLYVDGLTLGNTNTNLVQLTTTDQNKTYYYNNEQQKADQTNGKKSTLYIDNVEVKHIGDTSKDIRLVGAWNTTWFWQEAVVNNLRVDNVARFLLGQRFFDKITVNNSYFTKINKTSFLTTVWQDMDSSVRRNAGVLDINECVMYDLTGNTFQYNSDNPHKSFTNFTMNLHDSLLYNAGAQNYGYFAIYNAQLKANYTGTDADVLAGTRGTKNDTVTYNIQDNIIYHDRIINAETGAPMNNMFNGNQKYIGGGRTIIKFNGNRVIGTVKNIPPNTGYTVEQANTLMDYDFSGNFFSTAVDGIGKDVVFAAAPKGNVSDSTWAWDWTAHTSYLDYNMQYGTDERDIVSVDAGEGNLASVTGTTISVDAPDGTGVITADSFTLSSEHAAVEISRTEDFAELIDAFDIATVVGKETFYVRSYLNVEDENLRTKSRKVYTVNVVCIDAPSFNEALANGIEFGGKTFYADDTAVIPDPTTVITNGKFYQAFNGELYEFTVDNVNVFPCQTGSGYTYGDSGLDLRPARATAENGNILLLGSFYDNVIVSYPTNIYGTNAGIDPVDKTNATVENGYEAVLNTAWDMNGTTFDKIMVREDINGTVKIDGVTIQESVYDNKRAGKDYATFDFVLENIVANELADGRMSNTAIIEGSNPRNQNSTDHDFGKIANDSLTLRNFYIKTATTNQILNENSAHTVVIDNMYCDHIAAVRNRDMIAFFKGHKANYNFDVTIMNSIFRNASAGGTACVSYDGDRNTTGKFTDDEHNYNFTVTNNIFYKVGGANFGGVSTGALNSFTFTDNVLYASRDNQTGFVLNTANNVCDDDNKLIGNITVTGNKAYGFGDLFADWRMGENNPVYAEGFYTSSVDGTVGEWHADMGEAEWYIDEDLTYYGSDYYIDDISGGSVENLVVNNGAAKISFDMREGTTEEVEVYARNYDATYFWSTDAAGENIVDVIDSAEFTQALEVYYLTVEANGYSRTYEVSITAFDPLVFAEDYEFEEGYFGADAVLIDENVATLSTDTLYYATWQGTPYAFVVGVNVVANLSDTDALDVLVKSWAKGTNFTPDRSINLYTENYNVNPNVTDGLGNASPSHGADWGYNADYDLNKISVKNVIISAGMTGKVGMYGFNITGIVQDYSRKIGDNLDLHFENTLFTGEDLIVGKASGGNTRYLFLTSNTAQLKDNCDQTDTLTVKNMHVAITKEGITARLIGEPMYATVEFDGLYVDCATSAFNEWAVFAKNSAKNSSFTLKNSCLLNTSSTTGWHFEGMRLPADSYATVANALPEGYSNSITFENNIITGGIGHTSGGTDNLLYFYPKSFSELNIVDNYLEGSEYTDSEGNVARRQYNLFWAYGVTGHDATLNCDITITGNVINSGNRDIILQCSNNTNVAVAYNYTIKNNLVFENYVEDVNAAIADRLAFFGTDFAMITEENLDTGYGVFTEKPAFKLDVAGAIALDTIYEMTAPEGVVIDEEAKTITASLEAVGWEDRTKTDEEGATTYQYKVRLSQLLNNPTHNLIKYTIGDKVYTDYNNPTVVTEAAVTGLEFTATVYSPDGTVEGDTYTVVIADAPKHNLTEVPAVEATCDTDGHKAYYVCADEDCGLYFEDADGTVAIEDLEAWLAGDGLIPASHDLVDVEGKDATCTEDGYTAHKACTKCDYKEGYEVIPASHDLVDVEGKDATCTEDGYTAHKACTVCDYKEGYEVIPAGHNWVDMAGEDKTCTEDGFTAHKMCTVCFETEGKEVIPAGHTWGDYVYNNDATTEADGTETRTCSACGETETRTAEGTKLPEVVDPEEPSVVPDERLPQVVLNELGNGVTTDMRGSWATRVYWGYIGEEEIPYKWFDDFRLGCGTEYNADFTPRADKAYYFTKKGYYRFVLKCIISGDNIENYEYKDMVYTFYYDGSAKVAVPSLTVIDGNTVQIEKNGLAVTKLYYGNIGQENIPYGWFNDFWGKALGTKTYKVDFGVTYGEQYQLVTKGFYNFVIVYKDEAGATHEIVYTVEAKQDIGIITAADGVATLTVDNVGGKVNKLYWGYIGDDATGVVDYDTLKAAAGTLTGDWTMTTGRTYNLTETGYYGFCVNYTMESFINGAFTNVTYDIIYIVENN